MPDAFRITSMVPGLPERVYAAWLDSGAHTGFTGKTAKIDPSIGGKFTVLDGFVHGRTVELLPGRRIVQTWRSKEFPHSAHDSRLEIQFESAEGATRVTILHSLLPDGLGEKSKKTWTDRYFGPMRTFFSKLVHGALPRNTAPRPTSFPPAMRAAPTKHPKPSHSSRKPAPPKKKAAPPKRAAAGAGRKGSAKAARRPMKKKGRRR